MTLKLGEHKYVSVQDLTEVQINYLVAELRGNEPEIRVSRAGHVSVWLNDFNMALYTTNPSMAWSIIVEREMEFDKQRTDGAGSVIACSVGDLYRASCSVQHSWAYAKGSTHLIAAMRCYILASYGEMVKVPNILCS